MRTRNEWWTAVRWIPGLGDVLHAQWKDDTEGQSVHSEDAGLYGPGVAFDEGKACKRCCALVRNVIRPMDFTGGNQGRKGPAGGWRGNSVAQRQEASRRMQRVAEAGRTHTITIDLILGWWPEMSRAAAGTFLSRATRAKLLVRTAPGEYAAAPTAKP